MMAYRWIHALQVPEFPLVAAPLAAAWECDLANDALRWSAGVFALFGLPGDARLDRREIVEMYVGDSRAMLDRRRAEAIAACGSFTFDAQIRRLDGERRWMRLTADTVCRNGRAMRLYGTKQDVTDEVGRAR